MTNKLNSDFTSGVLYVTGMLRHTANFLHAPEMNEQEKIHVKNILHSIANVLEKQFNPKEDILNAQSQQPSK